MLLLLADMAYDKVRVDVSQDSCSKECSLGAYLEQYSVWVEGRE